MQKFKARYKEILGTDREAILCESYIRNCRNCDYSYETYAVRCLPKDEDVLICPNCDEPRALCNAVAVLKRPDDIPKFVLDDEGFIEEGIPKCRFHGGTTGNYKIEEKMERERADVILNQIYEDGQREFYQDVLDLDKSELADQMASYMVSKIFAVEDEDLSAKQKVRLQAELHKLANSWLKTFKEIKTIGHDDLAWHEEWIKRQAEIQKRAYIDAVALVLGIVEKLLGVEYARVVQDGLPLKLKALTGEVIEAEVIDD